jgi:UTP-glucose-1-phosphate uridylyltransferase
MKAEIRTAVFPVAGRGTRFLPATKASPKEMLPVVDKPLIQYAVEEALAAGAERLVFITGASKRAIEDHFDSDQELEKLLESQGKSELVRQMRSVLPRTPPAFTSASPRRWAWAMPCCAPRLQWAGSLSSCTSRTT